MVLCFRLMEDRSRHMRLREWLIAQIDSGTYAGLSWENEEKTMFRIPWKHAAKQDYRQNQDAALFKVNIAFIYIYFLPLNPLSRVVVHYNLSCLTKRTKLITSFN